MNAKESATVFDHNQMMYGFLRARKDPGIFTIRDNSPPEPIAGIAHNRDVLRTYGIVEASEVVEYDKVFALKVCCG